MFSKKTYILILFIHIYLCVFSQNIDKGFIRAQELLEAKRYYEALYEFQSVKTHDQLEENFKNKHIAFIYSKLKNEKEAIPYLEKLKSNDKNYLLGKAYFEKMEYSKAIVFLEDAKKSLPEDVNVYYFLGKAQFYEKKYNKALKNLSKAKELGKDEVLHDKMIGICYFFQQNYLQTISYLEYVKVYFPFDKEINNYLGMSYFNVARKDLAIKTLKSGIDKRIKVTAEAAVNLSLVFDDLEENDSAIFYLKLALEIDPLRVDAYYFLGNKYYNLKKYNLSQYYFEELLKINPNYEKAYTPLANSYFLDNRYDKAIEKYTQSTYFKDKPAKELNYIGICYLQANDISKAKNYFEEALKKDASFYIAYLNLANLSFQEGKYDEAISFLSYASKYEKNNPDINFLYAKVYLQLEKLDESEYYFKETIRFNSLKKQAYLYLGHLSLLKNKPTEALFYYDLLLTFLPNHFEGNLYKGIACYLTKEYGKSVDLLSKATKMDPENYKAKYQLCKALVKSEKYMRAYLILSELNEENPSDKKIYYMLYKTCKELKIKDEAKQYNATIKAFEKLK